MSRYKDMVMPALREVARSKGLVPKKKKEELLAQIFRDDFKDYGVDKLKVIVQQCHKLRSTVNHGGVQNVIRNITPSNLALYNP